MKEKLLIFLKKIKDWVVINFASLKMKIKSKVNFKSKDFWFRFFRAVLVLVGIGFVAFIALFVWYSKDLPSPTKVVRRDGYSSKVYDRNGNALYDIYDQAKRDPVAFNDMPDYLKKATVAVEDKSFYTHSGIDLLTPFRIVKNLFYFGKITGGSTLTQQLTRNVLLTTDRTVTRKIKEFILAIKERNTDQIKINLLFLSLMLFVSVFVVLAIEDVFTKIFYRLQKHWLKKSDCIVVLGSCMKNYIMEKYKVGIDKMKKSNANFFNLN